VVDDPYQAAHDTVTGGPIRTCSAISWLLKVVGERLRLQNGTALSATGMRRAGWDIIGGSSTYQLAYDVLFTLAAGQRQRPTGCRLVMLVTIAPRRLRRRPPAQRQRPLVVRPATSGSSRSPYATAARLRTTQSKSLLFFTSASASRYTALPSSTVFVVPLGAGMPAEPALGLRGPAWTPTPGCSATGTSPWSAAPGRRPGRPRPR